MTRDLQINRMQRALYCLRRFSGLGMRELGDKLGVTKQSISNWETGRAPLQRLHYMGIMLVLQIHVSKSPDTSQLIRYTLGLVADDSITESVFDSAIDKLRLVACQKTYSDMMAVAVSIIGDNAAHPTYMLPPIDLNGDFYRWVSMVMA